MTVTSTNSRNDYQGSGSTGPFAYTYRIFAATDLLVTKTDVHGITTTLTWLNDFTVTGVNNASGGTVTLGTALAVNESLTIRRVLAVKQLSDFRNQGEFFPADYEAALDYGIMVSQQFTNDDDAAVRLAETIDPATFDTRLPANLVAGDAIVVRGDGLGFDQAAMSATALSAWSATHNLIVDTFTSPGAVSSLTLSSAPGNVNNIAVNLRVSGVDKLLMRDEYSVSGTTLSFTSPLPSPSRVEVIYLFTYQVNITAAENVTYAPASGSSTDVRTRLRALDADVVTILADIVTLQGEVNGLHLADYGVVGDGSTDDSDALQAALTAGASLKKIVYGGALICKITKAITMAGPGLVFDYAGQGTAGDPGIKVTGTGYVALTVSASPQAMNLCVYGTGNAADGVKFNNPVRAVVLNIRVYDLAGFGVSIDKMYDCLFGSISVESCGGAAGSKPAFSVNDAGDTSNQSHICRLQLENCVGCVINVSPNTLDCVIDTIHSEGAVGTAFAATALVAGVQYQIVSVGSTDFTAIGAGSNTVGLTFQASGPGTGTGTAAAITWILGGASCHFNETRLNRASGTTKAWLRGARSVYTAFRAEANINVDLEATSSTSITLIEPNIVATSAEFPGQAGILYVIGGNIGTWSGTKARLRGAPGNWQVSGDVVIDTAGGGFSVKQGSNATAGRASLVGGTVTVATTAIGATGVNSQELMLTYAGIANVSHLGTLYIANVVANVSFDIKSTNASDDSDVSWWMVKRA
jgi:hypothetical protein